MKIKLSHCSFKLKLVNNIISMESLEETLNFRTPLTSVFFTSDSVRDKPFTFPHKVERGTLREREREREREGGEGGRDGGRFFCALNDLLECCRK